MFCIIVFVAGTTLVRNVELGCELNGTGIEDSKGIESDVAHEKVLVPF